MAILGRRLLPPLRGGRRLLCATAKRELGERAEMETDVLIVGGGPAGLAAAIRLGQLSQEHNKQLNVMLVEKGGEVGSPSAAREPGRPSNPFRTRIPHLVGGRTGAASL